MVKGSYLFFFFLFFLFTNNYLCSIYMIAVSLYDQTMWPLSQFNVILWHLLPNKVSFN